MIEIDENILINSLELAYKNYKKAFEHEDLYRAHRLMGWSMALESIVEKFAPHYLVTIEKLKKELDIDFFIDLELNLDEPTYKRKKIKIGNL